VLRGFEPCVQWLLVVGVRAEEESVLLIEDAQDGGAGFAVEAGECWLGWFDFGEGREGVGEIGCFGGDVSEVDASWDGSG